MSQERPLSIPPGLVVRLSRAKVLPGASAQADLVSFARTGIWP
jgi:hypothetical protein